MHSAQYVTTIKSLDTFDLHVGMHNSHNFTTIRSEMTDFLELNQAGLCAIDCQEYTRAVHLYRYAMQSLNEERNHTPPSVAASPRFFRALAIPLELDDYEGSYFTNTTASQDGQFLLYDVAFLMDFADVAYAYPFAVTSILYNMGLAWHLEGLAHPSDARLRDAQAAYASALRYFTSTGRSILCHTRAKERRLLFFALANNYGHTCVLLSDKRGTRAAQQQLAALLSDSYSTTCLDVQDEQFFRMSHLLGILRANVSCLAPAA